MCCIIEDGGYKIDSNRHTFPLYFMPLLLVSFVTLLCHLLRWPVFYREPRPPFLSIFFPYCNNNHRGSGLFGLMDPGLLLMFVCSTHQDFRVDLICCLLYKDSSFLFVIFSSSSSLALFVHWWETRGVIQMPTPYYIAGRLLCLYSRSSGRRRRQFQKKKSWHTQKRSKRYKDIHQHRWIYIHMYPQLYIWSLWLLLLLRECVQLLFDRREVKCERFQSLKK